MEGNSSTISGYLRKRLSATGHVEKYKALPIAKGYSQVEGVNFGEIFYPIENLTSIRVLMYLAATF